ncbi:MAG: uroporphyrinogen decarboxylase family protein, partial [Defluviitaleaceae bacterium]|nr:uroporphyrinogen decarboxylase family protein [Defluviitaleaceae bacterium]
MDLKQQTAIHKTADFYTRKKGAPILQHEFGYYSLDRWISEGHIKSGADITEICQLDAPGMARLGNLGWCEAEFHPYFEVKVIEDRGDHELEQDHAGRHVLYFKNRRSGFMPEYVAHPVTDRHTWERDIKWRMDPAAPGRFDYLPEKVAEVQALSDAGAMIGQNVIGGYMYLRSLVGPEGTLYMVYDEPELVHDMMKTWFELADAVIA